MTSVDRERGLRLFFALWPDAAGRAATAAIVDEVAQRASGKATREETLHLTLAFVGHVGAGRLVELEAIGAEAARASGPFTLTLKILGGFRDARVAWLGAEPVPASLVALAGQVDSGLAARDFAVERRPFAAHVTLARRCRTVPPRASVPPIAWAVDTLTLVASELGRGGSCYRILAAWPLTGATAGT